MRPPRSSGSWRTAPPSFAPQSTAYSRRALPSIALLAPVVLPLLAAGVTTAFGRCGFNPGPIAVGAGAQLVLALLAAWLPLRSTQELNLGQLGFGSPLQLRIDAVAFAFGLMVLVPAALVLTLQRRSFGRRRRSACFGVAAAMGAIEAGGVVLTALAGGTAATLAVVQLDTEDIRAPRPRWSMLLAAWLALSWAGAILQKPRRHRGLCRGPGVRLNGAGGRADRIRGLDGFRIISVAVLARPGVVAAFAPRSRGLSSRLSTCFGFYLGSALMRWVTAGIRMLLSTRSWPRGGGRCAGRGRSRSIGGYAAGILR